MRLIDVLVVAIILIVGRSQRSCLLLMKGHQSINNNYGATDPEVFSVWDETKPLHRVDPIGLEILHQGLSLSTSLPNIGLKLKKWPKLLAKSGKLSSTGLA
jgi:hypothetical protein